MKKILVPCDFSAEAIHAVQTAQFMAGNSWEIHLVHVIELPVMHDALMMPSVNFEDSLIEALKQRAEKGFAKILSSNLQRSIPIYTHVHFGPTALTILNFIKEENIQRVVMGTKGATGFKEVFVGSNTERIVRSSPVPVFVIRNACRYNAIKNIVFPAPVNFDEEEELIRRVKVLQHELKAILHLVWVNTPTNFTPDDKTRQRLEGLAHRYMLTNFTTNIFNDVYEETGIINFAHSIKADLIAMGTHGRKGLAHVFGGSLTEDLINHVDLPVWTFSMHHAHDHILSND
jgi:nucleotide-binding universal stress UspA family protein